MTYSEQLHPYHCDCDGCDFESGYALRVQRDSTCSGEVISSVFDDAGEGHRTMSALATAAVDVDAVPGLSAGFHVHVGHERRDRMTPAKVNAFWNFVRWEPVLLGIARGAFQSVRPTMNVPVVQLLSHLWYEYFGEYTEDAPWILSRWDGSGNRIAVDPLWYERNLDANTLASVKSMALQLHYDNDRHSSLNLGSRHRTWEFRLWNSTRSAWRMELWCGLSVALCDPMVVGSMLNLEPWAPALPRLLDVNNHKRTAELLQRQLDYIDRIDSTGNAPVEFTCL